VNVLAVNGGSSSLKFSVFRVDGGEPVFVNGDALDVERDADTALARVLARIEGPVDAVGHRLVFGGPHYDAPVRASDAVLRDLEQLVAIEPLHLPAELDLVYAAMRALPHAPNVLCFDTAFHRRAPAIAHRLPLPGDLDPMLQRYGFHGLSYEYIASKLPPDAGRTIVAHLGSGASLCAMRNGEPIDTTMGFTALGGLMMGTRPGDLDPGVVLRLLADGYDAVALNELFYHRSGLLGVSGTTGDMRTLMAAAQHDAAAREAVDLFVYQLVKMLGSMIAVLGGLDTLVFTGGIGEHAEAIRERALAQLAYTGAFTTAVIATDENLMIARHTLAQLG